MPAFPPGSPCTGGTRRSPSGRSRTPRAEPRRRAASRRGFAWSARPHRRCRAPRRAPHRRPPRPADAPAPCPETRPAVASASPSATPGRSRSGGAG
ncbi:MAG: hypothetical protein F4210_10710 [Holophagales bacterium]|nr:hypothetical protein [Holophagales bacterium]MYF95958.1 hypothetical protein [Holophagales bacterium]